jgi:O-antigen/teichoic acid export membrane protein
MRDPEQKSELPELPFDGRLLAKNSLWNLVGWGAPLLVALAVIPLLIKGLGIERFGALTLIWMGIGYFSLFDIGLGRALTKLVGKNSALNVPKRLAS